jgi:hypothetical protein
MSRAGKSLLVVGESKHMFSQSNFVGGVCVCVFVCLYIYQNAYLLEVVDLYGILYRTGPSSDINII